eukprot:2023715-Prymnesium_polylepis.1
MKWQGGWTVLAGVVREREVASPNLAISRRLLEFDDASSLQRAGRRAATRPLPVLSRACRRARGRV